MKIAALLASLALALASSARAAVVEASPAAVEIPALPPSAVVSAAASIAPAPLYAPALSAPATPAAAAAAPEPSRPAAAAPARRAGEQARLRALFDRLDAEFPLPESSPTSAVRARIRSQLLNAARDYADPETDLLETVARESDQALARIQTRLDAGEIDPSRSLRLSADDASPADAGHVRVGVYPVAADPFQWGHLLVALRAVGELGVDKVVFVLAGDDPRKPTMTPVADRHPMGREVLDLFAPFFAYSPIAVGTTLDGETNIFRLLALNADRRVDAWYMVGDDHYRLVDKNGNPDTLPKLEANFARPEMGHSPTLHALKVAFIRREGIAQAIPTPLDVSFLDANGFDASSTQVRNGRHALMPHAAYDYARRRALGLYGLTPAADGGQ